MDFSSGFEQRAYAGNPLDFLAVQAPGKGASQMEDFVLPALPDLLHEPGSSNLSSISGGLDCLTADVSPAEVQPVPQFTEEAVKAKHCHNCGATETPRWACMAQSGCVHAEGSSRLHAQSDVRFNRWSDVRLNNRCFVFCDSTRLAPGA